MAKNTCSFKKKLRTSVFDNAIISFYTIRKIKKPWHAVEISLYLHLSAPKSIFLGVSILQLKKNSLEDDFFKTFF